MGPRSPVRPSHDSSDPAHVQGDYSGPKIPLVTFYRLIQQARQPQRADRSAAGSIPTRAFRYCEPLTSAAAFGYYIFPPIDFSLRWDGSAVEWIFDGAPDWLPLQTAQFPGFAAQFDQTAPEDIRGFSPPFLSALQEPGLIQIWSGLIARTAPDISLLMRAPANLPRSAGYELYEGIVETDRWFGPLFGAFRLTRTHAPIDFRVECPLFQAQPISRSAYADTTLNNFKVATGVGELTQGDWDDYRDTVVRPNVQDDRPRGQYATGARKRSASTHYENAIKIDEGGSF